LPEIETDRNKLREVISNLVDNALKYTLKGGVKIRLSANKKNVRVSVTDTGIGVPKEEMPYLFQKFSRGKDISRLNTGGTGLGLHVGKKMVEALHGRIIVESAGANLGSTFSVEIPLKAEE
jgi:signal transduction histidine kinase